MGSEILKLKNLGPKCTQHLAGVDITTVDKLKELGTESAFELLYFRFQHEFPFASVYLYAIEGALLECDWREIPDQRKKELKEFFYQIKGK